MKRVCLLALALMAGTAQADESKTLNLITECAGYAAQMPADSEVSTNDYDALLYKVHAMYQKINANSGFNGTDKEINFAMYWSIYGTQKPLMKMVNLVQSIDSEKLQNAALQLWSDRNCALVTK